MTDVQKVTTVDAGKASTVDIGAYVLASDTDNVDDGAGSYDSDDKVD